MDMKHIFFAQIMEQVHAMQRLAKNYLLILRVDVFECELKKIC